MKSNLIKAGLSLKSISLVSATALLIMAIIAPIAVFMGLENNVVAGDAALTLSNLQTAGNPLSWIASIFVVVGLLDILIGWGLYLIFKGENEPFSLLTAWLRLIYGGMHLLSTVPLFMAAQLVAESSTLTDTVAGSGASEQLATQVLSSISTFNMTWDVALFVFGFHLIGLGILAHKSPQFNKILGFFIGLAGIAYTVDSLGVLLFLNLPISFAEYLFFGEVLLIGWLYYRGVKGFKPVI